MSTNPIVQALVMAMVAQDCTSDQINGVVGSVQSQFDSLLDAIGQLKQNNDVLTQHSISLNTIGWEVAVALGKVSPDAKDVTSDPVEDVRELLKEREAQNVPARERPARTARATSYAGKRKKIQPTKPARKRKWG